MIGEIDRELWFIGIEFYEWRILWELVLEQGNVKDNECIVGGLMWINLKV